jgi:hypothetical protein
LLVDAPTNAHEVHAPALGHAVGAWVTQRDPGQLHLGHPAGVGAGGAHFPEPVPVAVEKCIIGAEQITLRTKRVRLERLGVALVAEGVKTHADKVVGEIVEVAPEIRNAQRFTSQRVGAERADVDNFTIEQYPDAHVVGGRFALFGLGLKKPAVAGAYCQSASFSRPSTVSGPVARTACTCFSGCTGPKIVGSGAWAYTTPLNGMSWQSNRNRTAV